MTTVRLPSDCGYRAIGLVGKLILAVFAGLTLSPQATGQPQPVHRLYHPALPPGAIGSGRLVANGPLSTYIQPVEIRGPEGIKIATAEGGVFGEAHAVPVLLGMNIGPVYRLRVTNLPYRPGVEVYPTVEIVDRLYPPAAKILAFPIPIELTAEDLRLAAGGYFVTRIIYIEDPDEATPVQGDPQDQAWFDVPRGHDPLETAIQLGRPVAILRIGSRVPDLQSPDITVTPPVTHFERIEYAPKETTHHDDD